MQTLYNWAHFLIVNHHLFYLRRYAFIPSLQQLERWRSTSRLVVWFDRRRLFVFTFFGISLCCVVVFSNAIISFVTLLARVGRWLSRRWANLATGSDRRCEVLRLGVCVMNVFTFWLVKITGWSDFWRVSYRVLLSKRHCLIFLSKVFEFLIFSLDDSYNGWEEKHFGFWHPSLEKIFDFQLRVISKKIL